MKQAMRALSQIMIITLILQVLISPSSIKAVNITYSDKSLGEISWTSSFESNNQVSYTSKNYLTSLNQSPDVFSSLDALKNLIISHERNRENDFIIQYSSNVAISKDQLQLLWKQILKEDCYLYYSVEGYSCDISCQDNIYTLNYHVSYWTTKDEEDYVDKKVTAILNEIIHPEMNDFMKEKTIHDYIVSHIKYDETLVLHSAYAGLAQGTTVCQGYALLAQKMLTQSGVQSIIVEGTGAGQLHLWNLVKINSRWFHLDCTFDDPIPDNQNNIDYTYFNLSDRKISSNHVWNRSNYPRANTFYSQDSVPVSNENDPIVFQDTNLETIVRNIINKPNGNITGYDVKAITKIDLSSKKISNLVGIQNFTNLKKLNISNNEIVDVAPLTWLDHLEELDISNNRINNILPLEALNNLKTLDLKNNVISDISVLERLTNLTSLNLSGNIINNFTPVKDYYNALNDKDFELNTDQSSVKVFFPDKNLDSLIRGFVNKPNGDILASDLKAITQLRGSNQNIKNLEGLQYCTELTSLDLQSNQISNIDALKPLVNLSFLNLDRNQNISDISALKELKNLKELFLCENKISDISPLASMTQLDFLRLNNNKINTITALKNLTNLNWLILNSNEVSDVSPLKGLVKLKNLEICYNKIDSISDLASLPGLEFLWLESNRITDASIISKLTNLKSLWIGSNKICSINGFGNLKELTQLKLDCNDISNIDELASCTKISDLNISLNSIDDITALKYMKNLDILYANDNMIADITPIANILKEGAFNQKGEIRLENNYLNISDDPITMDFIKTASNIHVKISYEHQGYKNEPVIINSDPKDFEQDVDLNKIMYIYFDRDIEKGAKFNTISMVDSNNNAVEINATINTVNPNILNVKPLVNLNSRAAYKIVLPKDSLKGPQGVNIQKDKYINFSTKTTIPPKKTVYKIDLDKTYIIFNSGDPSTTLNAKITPSTGNDSLIWISDNIHVATVNNLGVVTPIKKGTCLIYVTTKEKTSKAICKVIVLESSSNKKK